MAGQLDVCRFAPTAGGTTDFTYSSAVTGYQSPTAAGVVNGRLYKYRAESADLSQWEIGEGAYNTATGVLARTTVLFNSAGTTAKISFSATPTVAIVLLKEDLLLVDEANAFTTTQKAQARANIDVLKKNYIINSAMMVSQENGTTAVTADQTYPVDLFFIRSQTDGVISAAQVASPSPGGSPNRLRATVTTADASIAAGQFAAIGQNIEGLRSADLKLGTASTKTVTLQFGVKAPAGTYCVNFRNSAVNRSYVGEYTIAAGEANTDVVKTVTLTLDTSGTWLSDTGIGLTVWWTLAAGTTFQTTAGTWAAGNLLGTSNQFNFMGTLSNVFELFDVSLTEGSAAPVFQVPDFATELAQCLRYWEKSYNYSVAPGTASAVGDEAFFMQMAAATISGFGFGIRFKAEKRSTPTIVVYSPNSGASGKFMDYGTASADVNATADHIGLKGFRAFNNTLTAATVVALAAHWTANARL